MNDLALRKDELDNLAELGTALRDSGYFEDTKTVAQAAVKVLAGRELGLGPVESMRSLHIIEGKIEMSADLLAQRVKAHPKYDYRVTELTGESCSIEFFQKHPLGAPESIGVSTFTIEDAQTAGLAFKTKRGDDANWTKFPRNMLFARAVSNGVAWFCPDVAGGGRIYVDGEISGESETSEPGRTAGDHADAIGGKPGSDQMLESGNNPQSRESGTLATPDEGPGSNPDSGPVSSRGTQGAGPDTASEGEERPSLGKPGSNSPSDDNAPACDHEWQDTWVNSKGETLPVHPDYLYCPICKRTWKKTEIARGGVLV